MRYRHSPESQVMEWSGRAPAPPAISWPGAPRGSCPVTDPLVLDIVGSLAWTPDAIGSIKTARVHHAAQRCRSVAIHSAGAATGKGSKNWNHGRGSALARNDARL